MPLEQAVQSVESLPRLPRRPREGHKGTFGTVLVVAGSRGMAGAAVLTGRAALRGGAGLVRVACPADVWDVIATAYAAYTTWGIPLTSEGTYAADAAERVVAEVATDVDVVAIGPGLGRRPDTISFIRRLLALLPQQRPLVVDADALFALSPYVDYPLTVHRAAVLTPHPGEFARLTGWPKPQSPEERRQQVVEFTHRWPQVVLLKGAGTLVCDGQRLYCNTTGNPGMATGGSGDVLTGIIAAFIAQGLTPFDAAVLGAFVHGRAGDLAAAQLGQTALTAPDLLDYLPEALKPFETSEEIDRLTSSDPARML
ncbi:MAG: NAD(P)H-hydrate dehydratase [Gemmataceae bacterium]|nr:NAD(P)H-hydrate dehydratase [Gemmataceae bacterium]MDW8242123.1 NAD(P)H-hydrate dehydratase [Thermogemmata sp.]